MKYWAGLLILTLSLALSGCMPGVGGGFDIMGIFNTPIGFVLGILIVVYLMLKMRKK